MRKPTTLLLTFGAFPLSAWAAGGHYPVDDAAITDPGDIQIETWLTRVDGANREFGLLPAWTPPGTRLELTAGYYRLRANGEHFNRFEPAAKWLFAPLEPGRVGAAASFTAGYQDGEWSDWLLNLPISYALSDHPLTLHVNAGWLRDRTEDNRDRVFWGVGFEWQTSDWLDIIGQLYREGADEDPEARLGLRFGLGGPWDHFDITAGRVLCNRNDWFGTVGLALAF